MNSPAIPSETGHEVEGSVASALALAYVDEAGLAARDSKQSLRLHTKPSCVFVSRQRVDPRNTGNGRFHPQGAFPRCFASPPLDADGSE